jgi:metal-sulfur cluster biosynthetic enzyme
MITRDDVLEALRQVVDPDLGLDIVELGLCYDVTITAPDGSDDPAVTGPTITVTYTLTSPGCPSAPLFRAEIARVVRLLGAGVVADPRLTFRPQWTPARISEDARFMLGIRASA